MWSKIKNFLRRAEARTEATLLATIGAALRTVTPRTPSIGLLHVATVLFKML
jgi:hypothetical protein